MRELFGHLHLFMPTDSKAELPKYFDIITEADKAEYMKLKERLTSPAARNRRGRRLESFKDSLEEIKKFCIRENKDDWKRCLVCGVFWGSDSISINTRHLKILVDKCKSSINGSIHRLGYCAASSKDDVNSSLADSIPILKGNFAELRQWTVRKLTSYTPQPKKLVNLIEDAPSISLTGSYSPILMPKMEEAITASFVRNELIDFIDDEFLLPFNEFYSEYDSYDLRFHHLEQNCCAD